jgi:hypothetical protein
VKRREFIFALGGAAVGWPLAARAQQTERVRRVAFVQRLRELGWIEGRNITIEYSWAEERRVAVAAVAINHLVARKPPRCVLQTERIAHLVMTARTDPPCPR